MAAQKKKATASAETGKVESLFSKEQLLSSKRFQGRRDVLNTLLFPGKQYTVKAVEETIKKFLEREVK